MLLLRFSGCLVLQSSLKTTVPLNFIWNYETSKRQITGNSVSYVEYGERVSSVHVTVICHWLLWILSWKSLGSAPWRCITWLSNFTFNYCKLFSSFFFPLPKVPCLRYFINKMGMLETFSFLEESYAWRWHPQPYFPRGCPDSCCRCWIWQMLKAAAMLLLLTEWVALALVSSDWAFFLPKGLSQWQESCLLLRWPDPTLLSAHLSALLSAGFFGGGSGGGFFVPSPTAFWHLPPLPLLCFAVLLHMCVTTGTCYETGTNGDIFQNVWSHLSCWVGCCTRYHLDGSCLDFHWTLGEPRDCSYSQASRSALLLSSCA